MIFNKFLTVCSCCRSQNPNRSKVPKVFVGQNNYLQIASSAVRNPLIKDNGKFHSLRRFTIFFLSDFINYWEKLKIFEATLVMLDEMFSNPHACSPFRMIAEVAIWRNDIPSSADNLAYEFSRVSFFAKKSYIVLLTLEVRDSVH